MQWYYAYNDKAHGPVSQGELVEKFKSGLLDKDTLLFRAGMKDWQRAETVWNELGLGAASAVLPPTHSAWDSARKEDVSASFEYAGFWIRFVAYMIDQLLLGAVTAAICVGFWGFSLFSSPEFINDPEQMMRIQQQFQLVGLLIALIYMVFFMGYFAATPGMMLFRLKIIVAGGGKVSYLRAVGRYFASFLSYMLFGIGYLIIAFDSEKRSLHDMICNTRIIRE